MTYSPGAIVSLTEAEIEEANGGLVAGAVVFVAIALIAIGWEAAHNRAEAAE